MQQVAEEAIKRQRHSITVIAIQFLHHLHEDDLVDEMAEKCLARDFSRDSLLDFLEIRYGKNAYSAMIWWDVLEEYKNIRDRLRILKSIMQGSADSKLLDPLAVRLDQRSTKMGILEEEGYWPGRPQLIPITFLSPRFDRPMHLLAIAEAYAASGHKEKAATYFKMTAEFVLKNATIPEGIVIHRGTYKLISPAAYLRRCGDFYFQKMQYEAAAKLYRSAWRLDPAYSLLHFLEGVSYVKCGQVEKGTKLIEKAHWFALGDSDERYEFSLELKSRGYDSHSQREMKFIADTEFALLQAGPFYRQYANQLIRERRFDDASVYLEKSAIKQVRMLSVILSERYFSDSIQVRICRINALLSSRKHDKALTLAREGLEAFPGNTALAIQVVPELDRAGLKKEGDEIYARLKKSYESAIKDYPKSPMLHDKLAWMMVNCNREFGEANKYAEKAIELHPKSPGYRATLAEIRFRQQDRAAALEMMKRCSTLDPNNPYYKKQLERFEKKPFDSPLPDEETGDE